MSDGRDESKKIDEQKAEVKIVFFTIVCGFIFVAAFVAFVYIVGMEHGMSKQRIKDAEEWIKKLEDKAQPKSGQ